MIVVRVMVLQVATVQCGEHLQAISPEKNKEPMFWVSYTKEAIIAKTQQIHLDY